MMVVLYGFVLICHARLDYIGNGRILVVLHGWTRYCGRYVQVNGNCRLDEICIIHTSVVLRGLNTFRVTVVWMNEFMQFGWWSLYGGWFPQRNATELIEFKLNEFDIFKQWKGGAGAGCLVRWFVSLYCDGVDPALTFVWPRGNPHVLMQDKYAPRDLLVFTVAMFMAV